MTFSETFVFAHQAIKRSIAIGMQHKDLMVTYLLAPIVLTTLFAITALGCVLPFWRAWCFYFTVSRFTSAVLLLLASLVWMLVWVALLRRVYAIMDNAHMTFKKSFTVSWVFLLHMLLFMVIRLAPSSLTPITNTVIITSPNTWLTLLFTSISFVWSTGLTYSLPIMTDTLCPAWTAIVQSFKFTWRHLGVTLASMFLLVAYIVGIIVVAATVVGGCSWLMHQCGLDGWLGHTILVVLFALPIGILTLLTMFVALILWAVIYRQIQKTELQLLNELIPPIFD